MIHTFFSFCILLVLGWFLLGVCLLGFSFPGRTELLSPKMGNEKWLYHVGKFECWDVWYGFMVIHQLYPVQIGYTAILGSGVGLVLLQLILLCTNFLNFCSTQRDFLSALWLSGLATHLVNIAFVIILWALI